MITGQADIKEAYQREELASAYIAARFEQDPFGKALHERQVRVVRGVVKSLRVQRLLEIACGPARVTIHVPPVAEAVAIEQSPAMLRIARERLQEHGANQWQLVHGDAFDLPFDSGRFDLVMSFRLIRHFAKADRLRLLAGIRRVLRPGGRLLFDVVNAPGNQWLHAKWGLNETWIDDYWFTREEFAKEMTEAGFKVDRLHPVYPALRLQYHLWNRVGRRLPRVASALSRGLGMVTSRFPLEWVALCRSA